MDDSSPRTHTPTADSILSSRESEHDMEKTSQNSLTQEPNLETIREANSDEEKARPGIIPPTLVAKNTHFSRFISLISDSSTKIKDPGPPPNGGHVAWLQVLAAHFVVASTWGYISSYGVFQTYYLSAMSESASAISWVGSVQIFLLFSIGTFSGRCLDAGFFRFVFGAGVVFQVLGVFMTSISTQYWHLFLAQGICTGIGNGLQFCPCVSLVSTYFSTRKTTAIALAAAGSATGGIVFPVIVRELLPKIGFGWSVRVLGFVILALDLVALALSRPRLPPRRGSALVDWPAFKEPTYVLYCTGMFLVFWGLYFAFYYVGAFAKAHVGFSYSDSINLLILMNGIGFIGRLAPAYFSDVHFGPLNTMIPVAFVASIMLYAWTGVDTTAGLYAFASVYGLFSSAVQALWPATLSSLTTDLTKMGTRMGMGFSIVSVATLTGSPLGGALVERMNGNYLGAECWAGTTMLVGTGLLFAGRIAKTGWKLRMRT